EDPAVDRVRVAGGGRHVAEATTHPGPRVTLSVRATSADARDQVRRRRHRARSRRLSRDAPRGRVLIASTIAKAESVAVIGMDGHPVDVEVAISQGLPVFTIVGLPDPSIQEARERVRAAIQSSSETWPLKRVTVNLSPA